MDPWNKFLRRQVANHMVRNSPLFMGPKFLVGLLVHNIPSLVSILRQVNTLRNFTRMRHFLNIILPLSVSRLPSDLFTSGFLIISFAFLVYAIRRIFSAHLVDWCDHCHTVWLRSAVYEAIKFMHVCMKALTEKKVRIFQYGKKKYCLM